MPFSLSSVLDPRTWNDTAHKQGEFPPSSSSPSQVDTLGRFVSWVILNPVQLTVTLSRHTCLQFQTQRLGIWLTGCPSLLFCCCKAASAEKKLLLSSRNFRYRSITEKGQELREQKPWRGPLLALTLAHTWLTFLNSRPTCLVSWALPPQSPIKMLSCGHGHRLI